jgi:uridine phosphorylase
MEHHVNGKPEDIARYVLCPGSQSRAALIAERFENRYTVSDDRGIVVYTGTYQGVHMTSCGTGMGGPALAIATEELGHLGADTFIRVGSCGAFQPGIQPGDILIASGAVRGGGTGLAYLPVEFPSVPTFEITLKLVETARRLDVPVQVGIGYSSDAFYSTGCEAHFERLMKGHPLFVEMESDTLFVIGAMRGWRTGAIFVSDGSVDEIKPEWGKAAFHAGVDRVIQVSLDALVAIAHQDGQIQ